MARRIFLLIILVMVLSVSAASAQWLAAGEPAATAQAVPPTSAAHAGQGFHQSRPMWCAGVADYCNVLDRVLPVPVLPGGRANRWQWWGTVRLLGMTLRYGEIVATFRVPYNPAEGITLDSSTTLSSVSDALARQKLAGRAVDLDRLATEAQVRTLQLTSSKEPKVAQLAARLGKVRLPIERPPVVVVDGMRVDLWIDSSSDDSLAYSTLNPTKALAAWVEDLREFLIEHFEAAEREQLAPQWVSPGEARKALNLSRPPQ